MARGSGVKRRREERIRAIIEAHRAAADARNAEDARDLNPVRKANPDGFPAPGGAAGERAPDFRPVRLRKEPEERDPEAEWKMRSRAWLAASDPGREIGGYDGDEPRRGGILRGLLTRTAVSAALFLAVWGLFRVDEPWASAPQRLIAQALTEDMDTRAAAEWYRRTFAGSPAFLPLFRQEEPTDEGPGLPVTAPVKSGEVVRPFAETLAGIEIAGESGAVVTAAETGRVTHVTGGGDEGYSVVIRHAGGRMTVYGRLGSVDVAPDDWVETGDRIGALPETKDGSRSLLYFAVRVDGRYVDPAGVVPLD
jgi:stage IV sporulation protein FA